MTYWIVYILRFPLIYDLNECHIGAIKMKKSSLGHSTIKSYEIIYIKDIILTDTVK